MQRLFSWLANTLPASSNRWDCKYFMILVLIYLCLITLFVYLLPKLHLPSEQFYLVEAASFLATLVIGWLIGMRNNSEAPAC